MGLHVITTDIQSEWTGSPVDVDVTEVGPAGLATVSFEIGERHDGATGHHFSISAEKDKIKEAFTEALDQLATL